MKKFLLASLVALVFGAPAMAAGPKNYSKGEHVTCEGVITRDPDRSTWLDSTRMCSQTFWQDLEGVLKACPEGSRCKVTAIIIDNKRGYGFGRVLDARRINQDVATPRPVEEDVGLALSTYGDWEDVANPQGPTLHIDAAGFGQDDGGCTWQAPWPEKNVEKDTRTINVTVACQAGDGPVAIEKEKWRVIESKDGTFLQIVSNTWKGETSIQLYRKVK